MAYSRAPFGRRLRRCLLPTCLLPSCLLLMATLPAAAQSPEARFEQALPGFKIVRVLWREGKLVLENEGKLLVLRPGDSVPRRPLLKLVEVNERGAALREASSAQDGADAVLPNRLIKLERAPQGDSFSVVLLSAAETTAPAPEYEAPLDAQVITPEGTKPVSEKEHQAPLTPATQQGGGGGL